MTENRVLFDYDRAVRTSIPEAVFCQSKSREVIYRLMEEFSQAEAPAILFTRLREEVFASCPSEVNQHYFFDPLARTAFCKKLDQEHKGSVAIVSAGTADGFVTWEAARTLEFMNIPYQVFEDCGVAGLWRLESRLKEINRHRIIIAVAGMEAALGSVLAGLTSRPIIGVPTSVGYGVCDGGKAALNSLLACCSPGLSVVNIDNGFGAACTAAKTLCSFGY